MFTCLYIHRMEFFRGKYELYSVNTQYKGICDKERKLSLKDKILFDGSCFNMILQMTVKTHVHDFVIFGIENSPPSLLNFFFFFDKAKKISIEIHKNCD